MICNRFLLIILGSINTLTCTKFIWCSYRSLVVTLASEVVGMATSPDLTYLPTVLVGMPPCPSLHLVPQFHPELECVSAKIAIVILNECSNICLTYQCFAFNDMGMGC